MNTQPYYLVFSIATLVFFNSRGCLTSDTPGLKRPLIFPRMRDALCTVRKQQRQKLFRR